MVTTPAPEPLPGAAAPAPAAFLVVVPAFNAAARIGRCLASLLELQPGGFELHVRVQDGGSTDGTQAVVEAWRRRLALGELPDHGRRRLSLESRPDGGIYDAVARGLDGAGDDVVMTWLGSDDVLLPGALATVQEVLQRFPEVRWLTGQPQVADAQGAWYTGWRVDGYARRDLRAGLHDGRALPFVMQEGTCWRASLYRAAGGLRRDLRLAGDWDLWRRFARTDDLLVLSTPLALWTRRAGQASGDEEGYQAEVERVLAGEPAEPVEAVLARGAPEDQHRPLRLDRFPGADPRRCPPEVPFPFAPLEGLAPEPPPGPAREGAPPHARLTARRARLRLPLRAPGAYRVALRLRCAPPGALLRIRAEGAPPFEQRLAAGPGAAVQVVAWDTRFATREPTLLLEVEPLPSPGGARGPLGAALARLAGAGRPPGVWIEDLHYRRRPA